MARRLRDKLLMYPLIMMALLSIYELASGGLNSQVIPLSLTIATLHIGPYTLPITISYSFSVFGFILAWIGMLLVTVALITVGGMTLPIPFAGDVQILSDGAVDFLYAIVPYLLTFLLLIGLTFPLFDSMNFGGVSFGLYLELAIAIPFFIGLVAVGRGGADSE